MHHFSQNNFFFSTTMSNSFLCPLSSLSSLSSTVFDTGIHGLGGRMGTRVIDDSQQLIFDHAAQFFTVSDPRFAKLVDGWLEKGLIRQWQGIVGELELGGKFAPLSSSALKYIGVNGMRPLADSLLFELSERYDSKYGGFGSDPEFPRPVEIQPML